MKLYGRDLAGPFKGPPKCPTYLDVMREEIINCQDRKISFEQKEEMKQHRGKKKKDYASFPTIGSLGEKYKLKK